jgi:hypothetical protein
VKTGEGSSEVPADGVTAGAPGPEQAASSMSRGSNTNTKERGIKASFRGIDSTRYRRNWREESSSIRQKIRIQASKFSSWTLILKEY